MIIKVLTRRGSGASRKLIRYILKYALKEETQDTLSEKAEELKDMARKLGDRKAFEKELKEAGRLAYQSRPVCAEMEQAGACSYGAFGKGVYVSTSHTEARKITIENGGITKYALDANTRYFDAGENNEAYVALWKKVLGKTPYAPLQGVQERLRVHLQQEGYAGIKSGDRVCVFDEAKVTAFPKGLFSKSHPPKPTTEIAKLILKHGINSSNLDGYVDEFAAVSAGRIFKRANNIDAVHIIISFSPEDKAHITDAVLRDTAEKFVELYGTEQPYIFGAHYSKEHVHLHALMSPVRYDGYSSRISWSQLHATKIALTNYISAKYPEISHSNPSHGKARNEKEKTSFVNRIRNERLHADGLSSLLRTAWGQAKSQEHFFSLLKAEGYSPYLRNGKITGIIQDDGFHLKWRLARLGVNPQLLQELDTRKAWEEKTLAEISSLRSGQGKEKVMEAAQAPGERTKEEMELAEISGLRESAEAMELENDGTPEMEYDGAG